MESTYHKNSRVILRLETVCCILLILSVDITKMVFLIFEHLLIYLNWPFFNFLITLQDTEVCTCFSKDCMTYVQRIVLIIFYSFVKSLWLTKECYPFFFMFTESFVISPCCVVTFPGITWTTSTITRYKNVQKTTVAYMKKLRVN